MTIYICTYTWKSESLITNNTFCTSCVKKEEAGAMKCRIQTQGKFWIVHSIALAFSHKGSDHIFLSKTNSQLSFIGCVPKHVLFLLLSRGWNPEQSTVNVKLFFASRRDMSVCVQKGGFMLAYFCVRILAPISYLKLWSDICEE